MWRLGLSALSANNVRGFDVTKDKIFLRTKILPTLSWRHRCFFQHPVFLTSPLQAILCFSSHSQWSAIAPPITLQLSAVNSSSTKHDCDSHFFLRHLTDGMGSGCCRSFFAELWAVIGVRGLIDYWPFVINDKSCQRCWQVFIVSFWTNSSWFDSMCA